MHPEIDRGRRDGRGAIKGRSQIELTKVTSRVKGQKSGGSYCGQFTWRLVLGTASERVRERVSQRAAFRGVCVCVRVCYFGNDPLLSKCLHFLLPIDSRLRDSLSHMAESPTTWTG